METYCGAEFIGTKRKSADFAKKMHVFAGFLFLRLGTLAIFPMAFFLQVGIFSTKTAYFLFWIYGL